MKYTIHIEAHCVCVCKELPEGFLWFNFEENTCAEDIAQELCKLLASAGVDVVEEKSLHTGPHCRKRCNETKKWLWQRLKISYKLF